MSSRVSGSPSVRLIAIVFLGVGLGRRDAISAGDTAGVVQIPTGSINSGPVTWFLDHVRPSCSPTIL